MLNNEQIQFFHKLHGIFTSITNNLPYVVNKTTLIKSKTTLFVVLLLLFRLWSDRLTRSLLIDCDSSYVLHFRLEMNWFLSL